MEFQKSLDRLNKFYRRRSLFNSLDELKDFVNEIHEEVLVKPSDPGWPTGTITSNITTSDTMEAIEWIKNFKYIHPQLDDYLKELEYFKNFSEEIGSRFIKEGRNIDVHNCILKKEGGRWEWKNKDNSSPRAIRNITKAQHLPKRSRLLNTFNMIEESYVALNANMVNNLKELVTSDVGGGYDPSLIESELEAGNHKGHGFNLIGDISFDYVIKDEVQQVVKLELQDNFIHGSLRLINYMQYPGSRKNYDEDYTNLPPVKILIEGDLAKLNFKGSSIVETKTEADYSSITI